MSSIVRANDLRKGKIVDYNGKICSVLEWSFHRQGRGGSTIKMKLKGVDCGTQSIVDCSVDEKFNTVDVSEKIIQYMYDDGDGIYCMESCYYPHHKLDKELIPLLASEIELRVIYINDEIKSICLPKKAKVKVVDTEPSLKSQTAKVSYKPATLQNGWIVQVPPFIESDEWIIINTEDMTYDSRA